MTNQRVKACIKCGKTKELSEFLKLHPDVCKECNQDYQAAKKGYKVPSPGCLICKTCGEEKPLCDFKKIKTNQRYGRSCIKCAKALKVRVQVRYQRGSGKRTCRNAYLKRLYGITIEDYEAMLETQGEVCAVCKKKETSLSNGSPPRVKPLAVDHDHETGKVRGLLCQGCNTSVGLLEDDIERVSAMVQYLLDHSARDQT